MRFSRLRVSGFKSFVDPTELHIEEGLTGVVGPNGCGKSNLLEAIRWVMGENRVKSLRGSGMDDVIFMGTDKRPARNFAEVTLVIDNFDRSAPADYNDESTIEVTRRIERESGSAYRINGKDVRQKDVQLLFADAATGAHSPALVSQGRIGSLINAKPQDRRQILEEAAGISGLHTRRKEAESRLRSAESNLVRVHDVVQAMESQISGLKRQAKQAIRYREVSGDIRRTEASLLYIKWKEAAEQVIALESGLRDAEKNAAEVTRRVAELSTEQAVAAALLPPIRDADVASAAKLQRLAIEHENMEAEAERLKQSALSLRAALEQIAADREREQGIASDAQAALDRLNAEKSRLKTAQQAEKSGEIEARDTLDAAARAASSAEKDFDRLSETAAQARARRSSLDSDKIAVLRRVEQLDSEQVRLTSELAAVTAEDEILSALRDAEKMVTKSEVSLVTAAENLGACEVATASARAAHSDVEAARFELTGKTKALAGEVASLQALLETEEGADVPIASSLVAQSGFEIAAGAAFGDDIDAGLDEGAARYWQDYGEITAPNWPTDIEPLSKYIKVPAVLQRRLVHTGIAQDAAAGASAAKTLKPGQALVDQAGNYWRWDGFTQKAGAPSQAAIRLEQKNRLAALEDEQAGLAAQVQGANEAVSTALDVYNKAQAAEQAQRDLRQAQEKDLAEHRRALVTAEQEAGKRASSVSLLEETMERRTIEAAEAAERLKLVEDQIAELPQTDKLEAELSDVRQKVETLRSELSAARSTFESLRREAQVRTDRLSGIATESGAWSLRVSSANAQVASLNTRETEAQKQLETAEASPEDMDKKKRALLDQISEAEKERSKTSDELIAAEQSLAEKDKALKEIGDKLAAAREKQIRADAAQEGAAERVKDIGTQIKDRFECAPTQILEKVELDTSDSLPEVTVLEIKLERFKRERDRMGAVNLRADEELSEISEQLEHLVGERADLETAIARLRQAIGSLNREGRERLLAAFEIVNRHFGELFANLFGGGEAHLELTDSDDPLDAGLEIYASPPGKRLQALSLLSGGEQALTALSLIFAVFITNPAPICVLDEVDAPLDDANVERFCNLLEDMTGRTNTRFLIVTHNAVSMARMSRLFGVTMAERGISTLVSVDLERAEELKEAG